jgi:hypothetical protein
MKLDGKLDMRAARDTIHKKVTLECKQLLPIPSLLD